MPHSRRGFVGAAACPARRISYAEPAWRKASPGGWCSAQRIKRDMTAGGSHTFSALAQLSLRLMRSKLKIITISWCKLVTFDLIRHGLRPVTPSPPGEGFSLSRRASASIFTSQISQVSGRGMPPPLHAKSIVPTAPHPAALRPPSPGGRPFFASPERIFIQNDAPKGKFPSGHLVGRRSGKGERGPLRTERN